MHGCWGLGSRRMVRAAVASIVALLAAAAVAPAAESPTGAYVSHWEPGANGGWNPPALDVAQGPSGGVKPDFLAISSGDGRNRCISTDFRPQHGRLEALDLRCREPAALDIWVRIGGDGSASGTVYKGLVGHPRAFRQILDFRSTLVYRHAGVSPAPICQGDWREPGGATAMRFYLTESASLFDVAWDSRGFSSGPALIGTGHSSGVIATADLIRPDLPRGREWLDFHRSGDHGERLDRAYIVRNHVTLNPRNPVVPMAC